MRCVIYLRVSTRGQAEKGEGEEGSSIPAQREACARHIRDAGWDLVDEYADRGESARSAERPQLQAMLARIATERDVDAVVVHKIDRLARNMEDHVAIRALLRRKGVALVSVTENVEETASGRLVEGIHALMAEFYSANLAAEIKKGMVQNAKLGGFPHGAPIGYLNIKDLVAGRQVARIVPDPGRAPLVTVAFEHYASGEWSLQRLAGELGHRGLTSRGRRNRPVKAITWQGLAKILANPVYVGIACWGGVEHPGLHEPLTTREVFRRVQELLAARSVRGTRERKHPHYLKGVLHCGVCGRRLSIQHSKGRYAYFFSSARRTTPPAPAGNATFQPTTSKPKSSNSTEPSNYQPRGPSACARSSTPRSSNASERMPPSASCSPADGSPRPRPNGASCSTPTTVAPSTFPRSKPNRPASAPTSPRAKIASPTSTPT